MVINRRYRIGFLDQFKVIKSAATTEELKAQLKREDYLQYGETYRANSLYDVAFSLPVFKESKLKVMALCFFSI